MSVAEQQSLGPLDELRIRLEGAFEAVESGAARYAALCKALSSGRWRRTLREQPDLIEQVLRAEGALREARSRCEKHAQNEEVAAALSRALKTLSDARAELHRAALRRLRASVEIPLEDALSSLSRRVLAAIPGDLRPGEKRLIDGGGQHQGWIAALGMLWILGLGIGPLVELLGGNDKLLGPLIAIAAFAAVFWMPFLVSWFLSGSYTLTNQRLIWTPRRGEPVQVELASLSPGSFKISRVLGWITVDAVEPFTLRGVENARKLAAYAEVLRWMALQKAEAQPLTEVAIFPAFEGEEVPAGEESAPSVIAVMRPHYAAFFRDDKAAAALSAITGYAPGPVDLEAGLRLLKELGAGRFDEAIRGAAAKVGVLMENPPAAIVSQGPIWQHLVIRSPSRAFAAKITWRHLDEVEPMAAKWRSA